MAQVRGFAIRGLLKYVKESRHPGGIPSILAQLPADAKGVFDQPIDSSGWYPYQAYAHLLRAVDLRLGRGDLSLCTELGRHAATKDAGTGFKIVAFFSSVKSLLERSTVFWRRYCDEGAFVTTEVGRNHGTGQLREFPDVAPEHCHLLMGWIEGMALTAGARTVDMHKTRCVHRGDDLCEYQGTWT